MNERTYWLLNGEINPDPFRSGEAVTEDSLVQSKGAVKVVVTGDGTEITWSLFSPNWASLYVLAESLEYYPVPYRLKYFLAGWFAEIIDDGDAARQRILDLLSKSDVHLTTRTFVKEVNPEGYGPVPDQLREAFSDRALPPERSLECVYDNSSGRFFVERIGPSSTIARMWGLSPTTFPCRTGHSYDQIVSRAYRKVLKTGLCHYDHVLASMMVDQTKSVWVPYQRVIVPHRFPDGRQGIAVMSELADVDIHPL